MNVQTQIDKTSPRTTEHFDVLIAGAGISGVGAAYHLTKQCPGTSFVALETQKTFGGTWSTSARAGPAIRGSINNSYVSKANPIMAIRMTSHSVTVKPCRRFASDSTGPMSPYCAEQPSNFQLGTVIPT